MNACVCSHALHVQFAYTLLEREKKVRYFLNRPHMLHLKQSSFNIVSLKSLLSDGVDKVVLILSNVEIKNCK